MAPIAMKIQAIFLLEVKPGFFVNFKKTPKANIKADTIIPNIIALSFC